MGHRQSAHRRQIHRKISGATPRAIDAHSANRHAAVAIRMRRAVAAGAFIFLIAARKKNYFFLFFFRFSSPNMSSQNPASRTR